jgi:hypothetical protein
MTGTPLRGAARFDVIVALVLLPVLVGVLLYIHSGSRDAHARQYCADTAEGIAVSDSAGKDAAGNEFKPCSTEQIEQIRNSSGKPAPPQEIHVANATSYAWFDAVTGSPRVWYAQEANGHYRFFDAPGIDPTTGHRLQPITEDVIRQVTQQQAAAAANRRVVEAKRAAVEASAREAANQAAESYNAQELAKQAQGQFDSGDYKDARETCDRALSEAPNNTDCVNIRQHAAVKLAQQLVTKGQSQLEQGQLDEAMWSADQAMKLDPTNRNAAKLKLLALKLKPHSPN